MDNKKIIVFVLMVIVSGILLFDSDNDKKQIKNHPSKNQELEQNTDVKHRANNPLGHNSRLATPFERNEVHTGIGYQDYYTSSNERLFNSLLELAGLDREKLDNNLAQYENNPLHITWMNKVAEAVSLTQQQTSDIAYIHSELLLLGDEIRYRYLTEEIPHQEFLRSQKSLAVWHYQSYGDIMSEEKVEAIFQLKGKYLDDVVNQAVNEYTPEISNVITNRYTEVEDVYDVVPQEKLDALISLHKAKTLEKFNIAKQVEFGEIAPEQATEVIMNSYQEYLQTASGMLTPEEFQLVFGN